LEWEQDPAGANHYTLTPVTPGLAVSLSEMTPYTHMIHPAAQEDLRIN